MGKNQYMNFLKNQIVVMSTIIKQKILIIKKQKVFILKIIF